MKKTISLLIATLITIACTAQIRPYVGGARADSVLMGIWVKEFRADPDVKTDSAKTVLTQKAVIEYVAAQVGSASGAQDSLDVHTDTLQLHNTRLKALELITHTHTNATILNNTTASFTTTLSTAISTATTTNASQHDSLTNHTDRIFNALDSIYKHTDSIQLHNTRIKALESAPSGVGDVEISGTPANNRLAVWTDATTIEGDVEINVYADSISVGKELRARDSIRVEYLTGGAGPMFMFVNEVGAVDTGWLDPVARGLTDKLWDLGDVLTNTKNGEIVWNHITKGEVVSTYGLPNGMNAFEALQYTSEMTLRLLAQQNKELKKLKSRDDRMTRLDYRLKLKLLKAEHRLR